MANPNSYSFGEVSDDDDEEEEQLAAQQEREPKDFASIFTGESSDEPDSSSKSIAEIFGIKKPEDDADEEPSAFDKIINHTLEEDSSATGETNEDTELSIESSSSEESHTDVPDSSSQESTEDVSSDESSEELDLVSNLETPKEADSHEYGLPEDSDSAPETKSSSKDSDESNASPDPTESGRAEAIPANSQEPGEELPDDPSDARQTSYNEPEPDIQPEESQTTNPSSKESTIEANEAQSIENDQPERVDATEKPVDEAAEERQIPFEPAEEADNRVREMMADEGSEDSEPPRGENRAAASQEDELGRNSSDGQEKEVAEQSKESPAGALALLLGAREIFKRRKGDKENQQQQAKAEKEQAQALADHEKSEEIRLAELTTKQEQTDKDIDDLKRAQTVEVSDQPDKELIYNDQTNNQDRIQQSDFEFAADEKEFGQVETVQALSSERFAQDPDIIGEEDLELITSQHLETNIEEANEQARSLNQELDGERAFDSRQETASKITNEPKTALVRDYSEQSATHISEVLSDIQQPKPINNQETSDQQEFDGGKKSFLQNDELRKSITAGVTIGLVITFMAIIFFLFR